MSKETLSREPAFPVIRTSNTGIVHNGLTKREYAAIKLGIPDSGDEYLDEIIKEANWKYVAQIAIQGLLAANCVAREGDNKDKLNYTLIVEISRSIANEFLKQTNNQ